MPLTHAQSRSLAQVLLRITAHYSGAAPLPAADSNAVDVTVNQAPSKTSLIGVGGDSNTGRPPLLISLTALNNGQARDGTIQFRDGNTVLATMPALRVGRTGYVISQYRPTTVAKGQHVYTALFVSSDTADVQQSVSNPVKVK